MSRKRNRSVRTLPLNTILPQFPAPDKSPGNEFSQGGCSDTNCFGEPVRKSPSAFGLYYEELYSKKNDNVDNILSGVRNLSFKSSSSSLSWSDDYESQSCQKIQDELEKIERVLCGIEPVPESYDDQEIKEWMEICPSLRIFGKSLPYKSSPGITSQEEQVSSSQNSEDCDKETTSSSEKSDRSILKSTVINTLFNNIAHRLFKKGSHKVDLKEHKVKLNKPKHKVVDKAKTALTNSEIDNYLKVSPIPQWKLSSSKCWDEHNSSAFLVNSDMSSAKWLKADSPEYNSLPFLAEELSLKSTHSGGDAQRKKHKRSPYKIKTKHCLVLPPIDSPQLFSDHFRSVSAMPTKQNNKCLSAISMKYDNHLGESKPDFSRYLKTNTSVKITRSRIPRMYKRWDSIDD